MRYFNRTSGMANVLLFSGFLFFILTVITAFQSGVMDVIQYGSGTLTIGTFFFLLFLIASFTSFVLTVALRCIVRDATEELDSISSRVEPK